MQSLTLLVPMVLFGRFRLPLGHQPVALYHLDEAEGTLAVDSSGYEQTTDPMLGIPEGGSIIGGGRASGACGRGVTLDGADSRLELEPLGKVFAAGIAVELWLRPVSIQAGLVHLVGDGGGGLASFRARIVMPRVADVYYFPLTGTGARLSANCVSSSSMPDGITVSW